MSSAELTSGWRPHDRVFFLTDPIKISVEHGSLLYQSPNSGSITRPSGALYPRPSGLTCIFGEYLSLKKPRNKNVI